MDLFKKIVKWTLIVVLGLGILIGSYSGYDANGKVDALTTVVADKASQADLNVVVTATRQIKTDLAALTTVVGTKADQSDLAALRTDVGTHTAMIDALRTDVGNSANDIDALRTDVDSHTAAIDALNGKVTNLDKSKASYGWVKRGYALKTELPAAGLFAEKTDLDRVWDKTIENARAIEALATPAPEANDCPEGSCGVVIDVQTSDE